MSDPMEASPGSRGFLFQHSNSLSRLAEGLAEIVVEQQRRSPLVPLQLTIPHAGVGTWLKQYLADRLGAAANLQFQQPTELIWTLARKTLGNDRVDRARTLDADALTLGIHAALRRVLDTDLEALAPIRHYLDRAGAGVDKARMGLAAELAHLFRDYMIYRPGWVDAWSRGRAGSIDHGGGDERWQRALWAAVWELASGGRTGDNPGALLGALLVNPAPAGAPLLLFGISHLPPVFVDVLGWAATARPVHLFMPSPCRQYWGDEIGERRRLREAIETVGRLPRDALTTRETIPNDLLASMGRMGQEFLWQVCDRLEDQLPEAAAAGYSEAAPGTRLGWLRRALLDLESPRAPAEVDLRAGDASIQLHACHSRLREVEVLHDQVLGWLDPDQADFDPPLKARDIIVVAPDIDAYAPFVRAVFGTRTQGRTPIPFNISDRKPTDAHPIVQAFLEVLDLPISDFEAEAVVSLLETPAIARRLGLSQDELVRIRHWAAELHIHWGVDAAHRRERGEGELPELNSWRHGLDRLLFGLASMQEETALEAGGAAILPWPQVEGGAAEAAGKLTAWVGRLDALRQHLRRHSRTAADWQRFLNRFIVEALFRSDENDRDEQAAEGVLREALDALATAARRAGVADEPLDWSAIRELLRGKLGEAIAQRRFLSRGVTFANTVPLRAVPARVVCMLGMNAGEFPRAAKPRAFDLLDRNRKPGDRAARDEDRYLFLETILAASDCLYLSWLGRDQQENNERDPSPLVSELRGYFDRAVRDDDDGGERRGDEKPVLAVTEHALQPFSPRNFESRQSNPGDGALPRSHKAQWLPAAEAARSPIDDTAGRRFFDPPEALPGLPPAPDWPEIVTLDELARFFRSPARHYLSRVLDVRLEDRESNLPSAHTIDQLLRYRIGREVNQRAIEGTGALPDSWPDETERLRGWLPTGRLEQELVEGAYEEDLVLEMRKLIDGQPDAGAAIDVEIRLPDAPRVIRVVGQVDGRYGHRLLRWHGSAMHGGRWMPVVLAAAALASQGDVPEVAVVHRRSGKARLAAPPPCIREAVRPRLLDDLLSLYLRGQRAPLVFFPETAWAWIEKSDDPEKAADAAAKRFFPSAGNLAESEKCAYAAALTRGWSVDDLLCGQFARASCLVFGPGDAA